MIYVLSGTPQQFDNFVHIFGGSNSFARVDVPEDMAGSKRPMLLLIGTWYQHPNWAAVLAAVGEKGLDGRPLGQAFAKMGSPIRG